MRLNLPPLPGPTRTLHPSAPDTTAATAAALLLFSAPAPAPAPAPALTGLLQSASPTLVLTTEASAADVGRFKDRSDSDDDRVEVAAFTAGSIAARSSSFATASSVAVASGEADAAFNATLGPDGIDGIEISATAGTLISRGAEGGQVQEAAADARVGFTLTFETRVETDHAFAGGVDFGSLTGGEDPFLTLSLIDADTGTGTALFGLDELTDDAGSFPGGTGTLATGRCTLGHELAAVLFLDRTLERSGGAKAVRFTLVPEPGSAALALAGGLALLARGRPRGSA